MSPAEWNGADVPPEERYPAATPSGWPTRLAGYAKLIATAITTLGTTGVLGWLEGAGVNHLPPWANAGITAAVGLLTVLFGPRNKTS